MIVLFNNEEFKFISQVVTMKKNKVNTSQYDISDPLYQFYAEQLVQIFKNAESEIDTLSNFSINNNNNININIDYIGINATLKIYEILSSFHKDIIKRNIDNS
jgi:hypothetical protein